MEPSKPTRKAPLDWYWTMGWLVALLAVCVLPLLVTNPYYLDVLIRIAFNGLAAVGLNLLLGYAGQISLGHAGFVGLGAYGVGIATATYGCDPFLALIVTVIICFCLGWLVAKPVLRLKGHYLAMATLGLGLVVSIMLNAEEAWTGGPDGMVTSELSVFGFAARGETAWFRISWILLLFVLVLTRNLIRSPAGRALRMIEKAEVAAQVSGIDTMTAKVRVFAISAALAGLSGCLSAYYSGFITPNMANIFHSVELITIVVIGGAGSVMGPVLGAIVVTVLPQALADLEGYEVMVFGAMLIAVLLFAPHGIASLFSSRRGKRL